MGGRPDFAGLEEGLSGYIGRGGLAGHEVFGAGEKLAAAGNGDIGVGREERAPSKANWDSDGSETSLGRLRSISTVRLASESKGVRNITKCLVAVQFHPTGIYPNWLKYTAAV